VGHHQLRGFFMSYRVLLPALVLALFLGSDAQALRVVPVPADPEKLDAALPAFAGRPTLLAAVVREASANVYYRVDADGDGTWDLDLQDPYGADPNRWYQGDPAGLDFHFNYPAVLQNTLLQARWEVSVSPGGGGTSTYGTAPVCVLAGMPDPLSEGDWATGASGPQLDVERRLALHDVLWYLHGMLQRSGAGTNQMTGWLVTPSTHGRLTNAAFYLSALLEAGHLPAYPPGTYEELGVTPPEGFGAANDWRWNTDPYAEDALRLMNFLLANLTQTLSLPAADEGDDGNPAVPGTNDGYGWSTYSQFYEYAPVIPASLAALADCGLAGTVAQTGSLARGKTMEFVVQQMVDYLVAAQYDENSGAQGVGAWGYSPCLDDGYSSGQAYAHHFGWAVHALHRAETAMGDAGVYVNQRCKGRLPNMLFYNPHTDGGPRYTTSGTASTYSMFEPTGHFLQACRWLGWDQWDAGDGTNVPYPMLNITRGQARQVYDSLLAYAASRWTTHGTGTLADPNTVLWSDGNFASGVQGHSFFLPMLAAVHGLAGAEETLLGRDWRREVAVDCANQQYANMNWYQWYTSSHYTYGYLYTAGQSALAALVMGRVGSAVDNEPPAAPAAFAADYSAAGNSLSWSLVDELDLLGYRIYRSESWPVPLDQAHLIHETSGNQYWDVYSSWGVHYRVVAVDFSGNLSEGVDPTETSGTDEELPLSRTVLTGAWPNPFNPRTTISFTLAEPGPVSLHVHDLAGRRVASLLEGCNLLAGAHSREWDGRQADGSLAAAGIYLVRLETSGYEFTRPVTLVK
jgi:hypothetical protein